MAKVKLTLEDHIQFIIDLGKHSWDKMADMGVDLPAEYPTSRLVQLYVGVLAAHKLFSGKHAIPDVTEALDAIADNADEVAEWV